MPLTLTVKSYKGAPPSKPASISIEHERISIGRQKGNSLVLNDPENVVSSKHAEIEYRNDGYYITDTSTNHTLIDQTDEPLNERQTLRDGQNAKLNNNNLLTLGDYEIMVEITSHRNHAASDDPFAGSVAVVEEKEDLLDQKPQNYDASDDFSFLDSIRDSNQMSVDNGLPNPDATDLFADIESAKEDKDNLSHANAPDQEVTDDFSFLDFIGKPDQLPTENNIPNTEKPQKLAQQSPSISDTGVQLEHIRSFLKGAGIESSSITSTINANTFYLIGQLLSRSLQGAIQVLGARSKIKSELGLEVTIVHGRGNNPLKFSPSAQESLVKMLDPKGKAYMPPNEAIDEAFSDIGAHEMAVMAGMRSALQDVLKRFNPEYLEQRLQKKSPISIKIPIRKQAMLWDLFHDLYDEIEKEAQDDFNRLFGRAFTKAYNDQLRKAKIN
jgi:type VI secretion system protein